jgi:hypothetical protein
MSDLFYLQDSRSYVGNDVMWWAKDGKGYTTDLRNAHIYSKEEAVAKHNCRETDIPWPKEYIDGKTRPAVDMQYIKRDEALKGTGIELRKVKRHVETYRCHGCGRFLTVADYYSSGCSLCGADNRP